MLQYLNKWPLFPVCGNALWQPIHVADLADAVISCIDTPATIGYIYNVAGAEPMRFKELMRAVFQPGEYPTGQKVSDAEMDTLAIEPHTICPQWNYTIRRRSPVRAPTLTPGRYSFTRP